MPGKVLFIRSRWWTDERKVESGSRGRHRIHGVGYWREGERVRQTESPASGYPVRAAGALFAPRNCPAKGARRWNHSLGSRFASITTHVRWVLNLVFLFHPCVAGQVCINEFDKNIGQGCIVFAGDHLMASWLVSFHCFLISLSILFRKFLEPKW